MTGKSNMGKWSVVMTGFSGDWARFCEAADRVFGRKGLCCWSLTVLADRHLPAELMAGLSFENATKISSQLTETGASAEPVISERLTGLRHPATDLWADRCAGTWCFYDLDGMIVATEALNARENLNYLRKSNPSSTNWQLESAINHFHPGLPNPPRISIEKELEAAAELVLALRDCYPLRAFTISHTLTDSISFWQTAPDSPRDEYPWIEPAKPSEEVWCDNCGKKREYCRSTYSDHRFPPAEWGSCKECGSDILVRGCEKLTFVCPKNEPENQP